MPKFRKKLVVIEAVQWWPPGDEQHDPAMLSHRKGNSVTPGDYRQVGDLWQFSTIRGMGDDTFFLRLACRSDVRVNPGDWIITGESGKKWVCESTDFPGLYEPVEGA